MNSTSRLEVFWRSARNSSRGLGRGRRQVLALGAALVLALAWGAPAQTFRVLKNFTGADGSTPQGRLVLSGGTLYGTTAYGGSSNSGVIFKINTDGSGYQVLRNFVGSPWDGSGPWGGMVLVDRTLYGTAEGGGSSGKGVVFKINTDGAGYQALKTFSTNAQYPCGDLLVAGSTLYGATQYGGGDGPGVIFRINTDGSGYTEMRPCLASLRYCLPNGGLALAGATLYGTTFFEETMSEAWTDGTVFKVNTDGSGYSLLKAFATNHVSYGNPTVSGPNSDGSNPPAGVVVEGGTLYGTTSGGGGTAQGVVFSVNTDGTGFAALRSFNGSDGASPQGGLVLASNILYGTTGVGGNLYASNINGGDGVVFQVNTDGTGFAVLKNFSGSDGYGPAGALISAGSVLYGTTTAGGSSNCGVVFALDRLRPTAPTILQPPPNLTAAAGDSVALNVQVANLEPQAYQWVFNGTNVLDGATNSVLQLTGLTPAQSGAYAVIVTNGYGAVTSSAFLEVIPLGTTPVASCTPGALRAAMAGPGPVTFACDGTILLTNTLVISSNLVVDGSGHWITLSGGSEARVIWVNPNVTFSALNLTLANGLSTDGGANYNSAAGGAIYNEGGTVNLTNCTFLGNWTCGANGAAANVASGGDGAGGAIYNSGSLNASLCAFLGNSASGGAGHWGGTVSDPLPSGGPGGAGGEADGGAICNSGTLTVNHSLFAANTVAGGAGGGGGSGTGGYLLGTAGGRGGDGGDARGAAVYNFGTATLLNCTLAGDTGLGGPGGLGGAGAEGWMGQPPPTQWWGPDGSNGQAGLAANPIDSPSANLNVTNCPEAFNSGTLQLVPTLTGGPVIQVSGAVGDTCRLLASPDLLNWTAIATNHLGPNGTLLFSDTAAPGQAQRFYRLALP